MELKARFMESMSLEPSERDDVSVVGVRVSWRLARSACSASSNDDRVRSCTNIKQEAKPI